MNSSLAPTQTESEPTESHSAGNTADWAPPRRAPHQVNGSPTGARGALSLESRTSTRDPGVRAIFLATYSEQNHPYCNKIACVQR